MLVRADASGNVMENCSGHDSFSIGYASQLRCRCGGEGHGVGERYKYQGEGDEAPAVVADVVEFEVVGGEVELRRRAEPWRLLVRHLYDGILD